MAMLTPDRAPIVETLIAHAKKYPVSFHVPGHKNGASFAADKQVRNWLGVIGPYDVTELPGLDDLHAPEGPIRDAQLLAAQCFGAEQTYFLVGGSTAGNLALITSVAGRGDVVLMQRNVHKSAIHALMLGGVGAVWIAPLQETETGIYTGITSEDIERGCQAYPEARAVFITNPNYYGMSVDVRALARVAHAHGKPLIVDEAHGAHFGLHPRFPESALQCGADAVVQSTHKMLSAMTMGAMLHVQGDRMNRAALERRLGMLQSSSPSYPIMASLDWARREIHTLGPEAFEEGLYAADFLAKELNGKRGRFRVWEPPAYSKAISFVDPYKRLIYDTKSEWSGYEIQRRLTEMHCYVEMADERYAVCAFSLASTRKDAERIVEVLDKINLRLSAEKQEIQQNFSNSKPLWRTSLSKPVFLEVDTYLHQENGGHRSAYPLPIEQAAGNICAEFVIPYPPGIPLLFPGERITPETAEALIRLREQGASFQGPKDRALQYLYVHAPSFDSQI